MTRRVGTLIACAHQLTNPVLPYNNSQAGLTPLQARTKPGTKPLDLSTAYGVLEAWADPNARVDEEGNTALHLCELPQIIEALAGHPRVDVNALNTVRQSMGRSANPLKYFPRTRDHIPIDTIHTRS